MFMSRGLGQTTSDYLTSAWCTLPFVNISDYCQNYAIMGNDFPSPPASVIAAPPIPPVSMTQAPASGEEAQAAVNAVIAGQASQTQANVTGFFQGLPASVDSTLWIALTVGFISALVYFGGK